MTNSELFIQLAGVLPLTNAQFQESFDINQDRSNISTDSDILGFRDATYADILIIMTYDGYTSSATGAVSAIGEDETFVNKAFALVLVNFANASTYTFAHEVAHLFGAHHETIDNCAQDGEDSGRAFAHGYLTPDLPAEMLAVEKHLAATDSFFPELIRLCLPQNRRKNMFSLTQNLDVERELHDNVLPKAPRSDTLN